MAGWTLHTMAATTITARIQAPALHSAATITSPSANTAVSTPITQVSGSCPSQSYVTLTVNDAFNGAALCTNNTYTVTTSLYAGTDTLAVQAYNQTDQKGPTANTTHVTYTPSSSSHDGTTAAVATVTQPLLLTSDFQFHTFTADKVFSWDLDLEGGTPPYNVTIDWGDGATSHMTFPVDPVFTIQHSFKTSGYYAVVVHSVDTTGQKHIMQLAALITDKHGKAPFLTGTNSSSNTGGGSLANVPSSNHVAILGSSNARWLLVAWPFYLVVLLMGISFWLGERQELLQLVKRPKRSHVLS